MLQITSHVNFSKCKMICVEIVAFFPNAVMIGLILRVVRKLSAVATPRSAILAVTEILSNETQENRKTIRTTVILS